MWHKKVCDICKKQFKTQFVTKKHCSLKCINKKGRDNQRKKAKELRDLKEENEELKKEIQLLKQ